MKSQDNIKTDVRKLYEELLSKCTADEKEKAYIAVTAFLTGCTVKNTKSA